MRYIDLLENKNIPCIVVDVQPAYDNYMNIDLEELMSFLNNQKSSILMFVNAEKDGLTDDTVYDVKEFWENNGFDFDNWDRVEIVDKGYGHLRSWMDYGNSENIYLIDRLLIKTIREMYKQKINDSRDLFNEDYELFKKFLLSIDNELTEEQIGYFFTDGIVVNWISIGLLKKYSGCYIMGGGKEECLKEVQLIMNAFNIKYKEIQQFIY